MRTKVKLGLANLLVLGLVSCEKENDNVYEKPSENNVEIKKKLNSSDPIRLPAGGAK